MADVNKLLNDTNFRLLPADRQRELLRSAMPEMAALPEDQQNSLLTSALTSAATKQRTLPKLEYDKSGTDPDAEARFKSLFSSQNKRKVQDVVKPLSMITPGLGSTSALTAVPGLLDAALESTTPGQVAGVGTGAALGTTAGYLVDKKLKAPFLKTVGSMLSGFAGRQAQAFTPPLFGEKYEQPGTLDLAANTIVPGLMNRFFANPAKSSPVANSRDLMETLGQPNNRDLRAAGSMTPEETLAAIHERLRWEGHVPAKGSTPQEQRLQAELDKINGITPTPFPANTQFPSSLPALQSQRGKIDVQDVKLGIEQKSLQEQLAADKKFQKSAAAQNIANLSAEQVPFRQQQRSDVAEERINVERLTQKQRHELDRANKLQLEDQKTEAKIRGIEAGIPLPPNQEALIQARIDAQHPPETPQQQVLQTKLTDVNGKLDKNAVNKATIDLFEIEKKNEVTRLEGLMTRFRDRLESVPFAYGGLTPLEVEDMKRVHASSKTSEDFVKTVFNMPGEQWKAFQKFVTRQEHVTLKNALGEYIIRESAKNVGPEFKGGLMRAPEVLSKLGDAKLSRFYNRNEMVTLKGYAEDLVKIRTMEEKVEGAQPNLRLFVSSNGTLGFTFRELPKLVFTGSPQQTLDTLFANPSFGKEIHKIASGAAIGSLAVMPGLTQYLKSASVISDKREKEKSKP